MSKNRLAGMAGFQLTQSTETGVPLPEPGVQSEELKTLVECVVNSGRRAVEEQGTDLSLVVVLRGKGQVSEECFNCSDWRTHDGMLKRIAELREAVAGKEFSHLCVCGPYGIEGEQKWFAYAEDKGGCYFSDLPVTRDINGKATFPAPSFRPATEADGWHNILNDGLFS